MLEFDNLKHIAKAIRAAMDAKVNEAPEGNVRADDVLLSEEEILKLLSA